MIAIVDTGLEEIQGIREAFLKEKQSITTSADSGVLFQADQLILYSCSSFGETMHALQEKELDRFIKEWVRRGKRLFAIGTGMHLLFTGSDQDGYHKGLNLLPGHVIPFSEEDPFEGLSWISFKYRHRLIRHLDEGYGYFSHAFYVVPNNPDDVLALNQHQTPAIVGRNNLFGIQFYPELSGEWGRCWLRPREMCQIK